MSAWNEPNLNPQLAAVWLDALLKSFVVLAFAGGLCLAWRRAAAATRHWIWFLGVAGLLLLPLLPAPTINEHSPTEPAPVPSAQANGRQVFNAHVSRNWVSIGFGAWAFAAMMVLLYPVLGRIQLARMAKRADALNNKSPRAASAR